MRAALVRLVQERATRRRERIAGALGALGVEARIEGDEVRAQGRGLLMRWSRDLAPREAGRDGA